MTAYYQIEAYESSVLDLYHKALEGYSLEDIRVACTTHIKQSKWFPKVSEIIDLIPKSNTPKIESIALIQAHNVVAKLRTNGQTNPPDWDDPITESLMTSRWNWYGFCEIQTKDVKWFVKEFVEAYLARQDMVASGMLMLDYPNRTSSGSVKIDVGARVQQLASGLFKGVEK